VKIQNNFSDQPGEVKLTIGMSVTPVEKGGDCALAASKEQGVVSMKGGLARTRREIARSSGIPGGRDLE